VGRYHRRPPRDKVADSGRRRKLYFVRHHHKENDSGWSVKRPAPLRRGVGVDDVGTKLSQEADDLGEGHQVLVR